MVGCFLKSRPPTGGRMKYMVADRVTAISAVTEKPCHKLESPEFGKSAGYKILRHTLFGILNY